LTTSLVEHEPVGPAGPRIEHPAGDPLSESRVEDTRGDDVVSLGGNIARESNIAGENSGSAWDGVNSPALDQDDHLDPLDPELNGESGEGRRTIKRYSNRKLYDTRQSRYVTLLQIAEMVRAGEDVQIIDNASKEDKTDVTLALIISEELKARPRAIPLATLKALIRHRGGKLLTQLRESPIGRLMPRDENNSGDTHPGAGVDPVLAVEVSALDAPVTAEDAQVNKEQHGALRRTIEQWQHTIDERIRAVVPHYAAIQELQGEVQQLSRRLEELEKRLSAARE
jgi:polyhydroxyalkanoate synthesis repressor PhaR